MTNLHNRVWDQVSDAEVLLQEEADFRGADIVLDDLADDPDVVLILAQRGKRLVDIGPGALDNESAVRAKDRTQIIGRPKPRLAHRHDQVGAYKVACQQSSVPCKAGVDLPASNAMRAFFIWPSAPSMPPSTVLISWSKWRRTLAVGTYCGTPFSSQLTVSYGSTMSQDDCSTAREHMLTRW